MDLPIEVIDVILSYMEMKLNDILVIRLISRRWSDGVKYFCSRRKTLFLKGDCRSDYPITTSITIRDRFFGAVNVESFLQIELKHPTNLDCNLTCLILRLFPDVEQLIFKAQLERSTTMNFIKLISHWKNISTLSFEKCAPLRRYQIPIASAINKLKKLVRLDLPSNFDTSLLLQTLRRIQHLSLGSFKPIRCKYHNVIRRLGPNCTRLWINEIDCGWSRISPNGLYSWTKVNGGLCNRCTHFGCISNYRIKEKVEIISNHFPSLRTIYIIMNTNYSSFAEIGHISTLSELHVLWARVHVFLDIPINISRPMVNVHTFEFRSYRCDYDCGLVARNVQKFCNILAWLLPNVKHLIFVFNELAEVEIFQQNLFMFKNLCTHNVKQWSQIE